MSQIHTGSGKFKNNDKIGWMHTNNNCYKSTMKVCNLSNRHLKMNKAMFGHNIIPRAAMSAVHYLQTKHIVHVQAFKPFNERHDIQSVLQLIAIILQGKCQYDIMLDNKTKIKLGTKFNDGVMITDHWTKIEPYEDNCKATFINKSAYRQKMDDIDLTTAEFTKGRRLCINLLNLIRKKNIPEEMRQLAMIKIDKGLKKVFYVKDVKEFNKLFNTPSALGVQCRQCNVWNALPTLVQDEMELYQSYGYDYEVDVDMVCGYCHGDVASIVKYDMDDTADIEDIDRLYNVVLRGRLEEMAKMKYLDGFDNMKATQQTHIINSDMTIMINYLSIKSKNVYGYPANMNKSDMDKLRDNDINVIMQSNIKMVTCAPSLLTEYVHCIATCMNMYVSKQYVIAAAHYSLEVNAEVHYWYCGDMMRLYSKTLCHNYKMCECALTAKTPMIFGTNIINMKTSDVIDMVTHSGGVYIVMFNGCDSNKVEYVQIGDYVNICTNITSEVITAKCKKVKQWLDTMLIKRGDYYYYTVEIKRTDNFVIKYMTMSLLNIDTNQVQITYNDALTDINIPLPDITSITGALPLLNYKMHTVKFNRKFFQALCIRNINGKMHINSLRQYAVGYAIRRYTLNNVILTNSDIDYDMIDVHILLCMIVMMKKNSTNNISFELIKICDNIPFVKHIIHNAGSKLNLAAIVGYLLMMYNKLGARNVNVSLFSEKIAKQIKILISDDTFNDTINNTLNVEYEANISLYGMKNIGDGHFKAYNACKHHTMRCEHDDIGANICTCCGMKCYANMCHCCMPPVKQPKIKVKPVNKTPVNKTVTLQTALMRIKELHNATMEQISSALDNDYVKYVMNPMAWHMQFSDTINIPYVPIGVSTVNIACFELIEKFDSVNTQPLSCGYEAYTGATGSSITIDTFQALCGNDRNYFSVDELMRITEYECHNIVILSQDAAFVCHYNTDSTYFGLIIHSSYYDKYIKHYVFGRGRIVMKPNILPVLYKEIDNTMRSNMWNEHGVLDMSAENVDPSLILRIEYYIMKLATDLPIKLDRSILPNIQYFDGAPHLTNVDTQQLTNIYEGVVCMPLRTHNMQLDAILDGTYQTVMKMIEERGYNKEYSIPDDLSNVYLDATLSIIYEMVNLILMIDSDDQSITKMNMQCKIGKINNICLIKMDTSKMKTLDVIGVKNDNGIYVPKTINIINGHVFFNGDDINSRDVSIRLYKVSVSSLYRNLLYYSESIPSGYDVRNALARANLTLGVPGSGKTTTIIDQAKEGDLIVVVTSGARTNIKNRLKRNVNVMTLERANIVNQKCNNLFVDEATMVDYVQIAKLLTNTKKSIKLFGDNMQIGLIDMLSAPGVRHLTPITSYIDNDRITTMNKMYRCGGELVKHLTTIQPGLVADMSVSTAFSVIDLDLLNEDDIVRLIRTHDVTMVLTYYTVVGNIIKAYNTGVPVSNIHSYQGCETDIAMVVYHSATNSRNLLKDKRYMLSALTRARRKVVLVRIKPQTHFTSLSNLLLEGGYTLPLNIINHVLKYSSMSMHTYMHTTKHREKFVHLITNNCCDSMRVVIKDENVYTIVIDLPSKQIEITCNCGNISANVNLNIFNMSTVIMLNDDINMINHSDKYEYMSIRAANKVRVIAYIAGSVCGYANALLFYYGNTLYKISTYNKCAIYTGFRLTNVSTNTTTMLVMITGKLGTHVQFTKYIVDEYTILFEQWLCGSTALLERDDLWFNKLNISAWDVIHTYINAIVSCEIAHCFGVGLCSERTLKKQKTKEIADMYYSDDEDNEFIESSGRQVSDIYMLCRKSKSSKLFTYTLINENKKVIDMYLVIPDYKQNQLARVCNVLLCNYSAYTHLKIKYNLLKKQLIGVNWPEALALPMDYHFERKTRVGVYVERKLAKMHAATMTTKQNVIYISNATHDIMANTHVLDGMQHCFVSMQINSPINGMIELAEVISMTMLYHNSSNISCLYIGVVPYMLTYQRMHFVHVHSFNYSVNNVITTLTKNQYLQEMALYNDKIENGHQSDINIVSKLSKHDVVNYGINLMSISPEKLMNEMLEMDVRQIHGILLDVNTKSRHYYIRHTKKDYQLIIAGCPLSIKVDNTMYNLLNSGKTYDNGENMLVLNVIYAFCDLVYVDIKLKTHVVQNNKVVTLPLHSISDINMTIEVPYINLELTSMLRDEPLIIKKKFSIQSKLYKMMMHRLHTGDDDVESLLAFARSLASTTLISNTQLKNAYTVDVNAFVDTVYFAVYVHNNALTRLKLIKLALTNITDNESMRLVVSEIVTLYMIIATKLIDVNEVMTMIINKVTELGINKVFNTDYKISDYTLNIPRKLNETVSYVIHDNNEQNFNEKNMSDKYFIDTDNDDDDEKESNESDSSDDYDANGNLDKSMTDEIESWVTSEKSRDNILSDDEHEMQEYKQLDDTQENYNSQDLLELTNQNLKLKEEKEEEARKEALHKLKLERRKQNRGEQYCVYKPLYKPLMNILINTKDVHKEITLIKLLNVYEEYINNGDFNKELLDTNRQLQAQLTLILEKWDDNYTKVTSKEAVLQKVKILSKHETNIIRTIEHNDIMQNEINTSMTNDINATLVEDCLHVMLVEIVEHCALNLLAEHDVDILVITSGGITNGMIDMIHQTYRNKQIYVITNGDGKHIISDEYDCVNMRHIYSYVQTVIINKCMKIEVSTAMTRFIMTIDDDIKRFINKILNVKYEMMFVDSYNAFFINLCAQQGHNNYIIYDNCDYIHHVTKNADNEHVALPANISAKSLQLHHGVSKVISKIMITMNIAFKIRVEYDVTKVLHTYGTLLKKVTNSVPLYIDNVHKKIKKLPLPATGRAVTILLLIDDEMDGNMDSALDQIVTEFLTIDLILTVVDYTFDNRFMEKIEKMRVYTDKLNIKIESAGNVLTNLLCKTNVAIIGTITWSVLRLALDNNMYIVQTSYSTEYININNVINDFKLGIVCNIKNITEAIKKIKMDVLSIIAKTIGWNNNKKLIESLSKGQSIFDIFNDKNAKTLNEKHALHANFESLIRQPINSCTIDLTHLELNFYIIEPVKYLVIYNPKTQHLCVPMCISYFLKAYEQYIKMTYDDENKATMTTVKQCVDMCLKYTLNVILIEERTNIQRLYYMYKNQPTIVLVVRDADEYSHCLLANITHGEIITVKTFGHEYVNEYNTNYLRVNNIIGNEMYTILCRAIMTNDVYNPVINDEISYRLKSKMVISNILNYKCITLMSMRQMDHIIATDDDVEMNDFSAILMPCVDGLYYVGFKIKQKDECIFIMSTKNQLIPVVMSMRMQIIKNKRLRKMIIDVDMHDFVLNKETNIVLNKINNNDAYYNILSHRTNNTVYVAHYDNRSHHGINASAFLHVCRNVKYITLDNMDVKKQMLDTFNKPYNRLTLEGGYVVIVTEIGDDVAFDVVTKYLSVTNNAWTNDGNTIKHMKSISEVIMNKIKSILDTTNNKMIAKNKRQPGTIVTVTKDELLAGFAGNVDLYTTYCNQKGLHFNDDETLYTKFIVVDYKIKQWLNVHQLLQVEKTRFFVDVNTKYLYDMQLKCAMVPCERGGDETDLIKHINTVSTARDDPQQTDKPIHNMIALTNLQTNDVSLYNSMHNRPTHTTNSMLTMYEPIIFVKEMTYVHHTFADIIPAEVQDIHDNTDLTDWLVIYGTKQGIIKTREEPNKISNVTKIMINKYPRNSMPVLTTVAYEEVRAIIGRIYSVNRVRTIYGKNEKNLLTFIDAYFTNEYKSMMDAYNSELLTFDADATREWLLNHKDTEGKWKMCIKLLDDEILIKEISNIKIHIKMESLLKDEPITNIREQQARIILWQRYAVSAVYAPIFLAAKKRLKALFSNRIIWTDGMAPQTINKALHNVSNDINYMLENDLTKQDRQTDNETINFEFMIYACLGVSPVVLSSWRSVHTTWRWHSNYATGQRHNMRLTGQQTTSIGNVITCMLVHANLIRNNKSSVQCALFLGDDSLIMLSQTINIKNLKNYIAINHNMLSKCFMREKAASFCRFIITKNYNGGVTLGPDYIRLHDRYEVTNGVREFFDDEMRELRRLSYCCMVGYDERYMTPHDRESVPDAWYDRALIINACAHIYNTTDDYVIQMYKKMMEMLNNDRYYVNKYRIWVTKN